jgi:hypothetical protein
MFEATKTSQILSNAVHDRGRPPLPPLHLTALCLDRLDDLDARWGVRPVRLFRSAGCSKQHAINILKGEAKQSSQTLAAAAAVGSIVLCPADQIVVGRTLPPAPVELIEFVLRDLVRTARSSQVLAFFDLRIRELDAQRIDDYQRASRAAKGRTL